MKFINPFYERDLEIHKLRKEGLTLDAVGEKFSISRERVRQILLAVPKREYTLEDRLKRRQGRPWVVATQSSRITCYICRKKLPNPKKFCDDCVKQNKLNRGGKELTRGTVRGRDNNTCQVCGYVWKGTEKKRLDVHHLEGLCGKLTHSYDGPEMTYKLITVCHKCHYNLHDHAKYGLKSK